MDASTENDPKHNYGRDVGLEITRIATKKSTLESKYLEYLTNYKNK